MGNFLLVGAVPVALIAIVVIAVIQQSFVLILNVPFIVLRNLYLWFGNREP